MPLFNTLRYRCFSQSANDLQPTLLPWFIIVLSISNVLFTSSQPSLLIAPTFSITAPQTDPASSPRLKLHSLRRPHLVQDPITALIASNGISALQGYFGIAVAAEIGDWGSKSVGEGGGCCAECWLLRGHYAVRGLVG